MSYRGIGVQALVPLTKEQAMSNPADDDEDWRTPPDHYKSASGLQPWHIIDQFGLGYYEGNVLKYLLRLGKKDIAPRLDDLKKIRNYVDKLISLEEDKS